GGEGDLMATPQEHAAAAIAALQEEADRVYDSFAPANADSPYIVVHTTPPYVGGATVGGRTRTRSWRIVTTCVGRTPEGVREMQAAVERAFDGRRLLPGTTPMRREFGVTMNRDDDAPGPPMY